MHIRSFRISGVRAYRIGPPLLDGAGHGRSAKTTNWVSVMCSYGVLACISGSTEIIYLHAVGLRVFVMSDQGGHHFFLHGGAGVFDLICYLGLGFCAGDLVVALALWATDFGLLHCFGMRYTDRGLLGNEKSFWGHIDDHGASEC